MPRGSDRPRLMFVLGLSPTKIGGIEKFLRYFVASLDAAGWDTILCFDGPISQQFREYVSSPSVTLESLDHQGDLGFMCASRLWALLRQHRPRAFVYAFNGVMRCFPWLAKLAGCKRIFFNDHSSRPPDQPAQPLSLPKRIVGRILTWPLTGICSVSEFTRRTGTIFGTTSAPNVVVSNGVEIREVDPKRRGEFRSRYGLSNDAVVITQVCWMVAVKGVDVMLRAAATLLQQTTNVRFVLVGDGSLLNEYQRLAGELGVGAAVTFTGVINDPTDAGVFDASDIYCQPSRWQEASGLAVLEAMSLKVPVVASDTGGLPELVEDGRTGLLVPVGDSDRLAKALERLVTDPELRRTMGEASYDVARTEHRIEDTAAKYVELFLRAT
jgi:glycosyltransferase involved in cell wall biosynthesis